MGVDGLSSGQWLAFAAGFLLALAGVVLVKASDELGEHPAAIPLRVLAVLLCTLGAAVAAFAASTTG
ncbi:hypothetical protein [Nocardioides sp. LML1-1-1.1]|uniref:hypothetical protein n=1 Tax=Nocardioides sp. LML1-1-1.1 TaxID=3135248 RepID=UPI003426C835